MFRTLARYFRFCLQAALILIGVVFAVSNRGKIELSFYPIGYELQIPIYLFGIILFTIGLLLGWTIASATGLKARFSRKTTEKRVAALENELAALRTEQLIRPAALPPR